MDNSAVEVGVQVVIGPFVIVIIADDPWEVTQVGYPTVKLYHWPTAVCVTVSRTLSLFF